MDFGWTLNFLLFFTGLSLAAVAILLSTQLERAQRPIVIRDWIVTVLLIGVLLQIIALFSPQIVISSYWFVIAAIPFLLPAPILSQANVGEDRSEEAEYLVPKELPSRSAPAEFNEQLSQIPRVLSQNPDGLTLVEIGDHMGVEWRRLTGAASELMDSGRIEKDGKKYFLKKSSS